MSRVGWQNGRGLRRFYSRLSGECRIGATSGTDHVYYMQKSRLWHSRTNETVLLFHKNASFPTENGGINLAYIESIFVPIS